MPRSAVRHRSPGTGTSTTFDRSAPTDRAPHATPRHARSARSGHTASCAPSALPHHHAPSVQHVPLISRAACPAGPAQSPNEINASMPAGSSHRSAVAMDASAPANEAPHSVQRSAGASSWFGIGSSVIPRTSGSIHADNTLGNEKRGLGRSRHAPAHAPHGHAGSSARFRLGPWPAARSAGSRRCGSSRSRPAYRCGTGPRRRSRPWLPSRRP